MKKILSITFIAFLIASCSPVRHAIHVEMRYPSKSGIELTGKNIAVVHLENDNPLGNALGEGIADGLAYALENDYGTGDGSIGGGAVGIYRVRVAGGGDDR